MESTGFSNQIQWFTSLVSKGENLNSLKKSLNKLGARQIEIMKMSQGQKISHFIGWSFLSQDE
ncbi:MAG: RlmF-related methyltransferase [Desulfobacterales bacterium]|nr:RlmF-related methyltransferase [Desulfobacterales bacterium]